MRKNRPLRHDLPRSYRTPSRAFRLFSMSHRPERLFLISARRTVCVPLRPATVISS
jgi:hypothetical protein